MGLLNRFTGYPPGRRYAGPAAYCDDYTLVPRPGFYALKGDGKSFRRPLLRLVWVDDAPGDPEDGAGHYEAATTADAATRGYALGPVVEFEAESGGDAMLAIRNP